jgi:tetratricopeptide (TPR) repeat protein
MNMKQYISELYIILFLIISFILSCNNENKGKKDTVYVPSKLNIDSANASEFANSFILDIYNSDTVRARSKIHIKYNSDSIFVSDLLANEGVFNNFDLFSVLHQPILLGGELDFQFYEVQNESNIIWLRLFTAPLEVNYFRITLAIMDNAIVISDFTSFNAPNSCNEMMTELVDLMHAKNQLDDNDVTEGFRLMDSTIIAFSSLDPGLAALYYSKMDIALRETALMKSIKYNLDFHSSAEIRANALMRKNYEIGKDGYPVWYWLKQYYLSFDSESYPKVREAIKGLSKSVGEDPILIYLNAATYFEEYNYSTALELYNEALTMEPTIPNIHFAKVVCLIEMKEFIQAVESLLVMEDYFDVRNTNWDKEFMAYPAFLISDEYFQWLERVGVIEDEELI